MLEIYHITLLNWWRERLTWRGRPVPTILSTPDRAFADMRTLLNRSRGTKKAAELRGQNIPLPFASLSEAGLEEYDGARDSSAVIRKMWSHSDETVAVNVDWPTPVNLPYQIDFWCETQRQRRHFQDLIRNLFKLQVAYVLVDFENPPFTGRTEAYPPEVALLGQRKVALNRTAWSDNSNLEPGEGQRTIRFTLGMSMNAWMARPFTEVPTVRQFQINVLLLPGEALIDTLTVDDT